jgi:molybdenum cofactor biosynthesis enzyme MoaA
LKFDEKIAENLKNNKFSRIFTSIDAGTSETFSLVKGLDSFQDFLTNVKKYLQYGKVTLKYIVMPGINDSDADFCGITRVMKNMGLDSLYITRDYNAPVTEKVLKSISRLVSMLEQNELKCDYRYYLTREESAKVDRLHSII